MVSTAVRSLVLALSILFLTQCRSSYSCFSGTRHLTLKRLGYDPVILEQPRGDSRYRGFFKVNDCSLPFLIDSGANRTDLDREIAKQVGVLIDHSSKVTTRGALGRQTQSGIGIGSLEMGPVIAKGFAFIIPSKSNARTAPGPFVGQIGLDALSSAGSVIDLAEGILWVPGARSSRRCGAAFLERDFQRGLGEKFLLLEQAQSSPHLLVQAMYQAQALCFIVDTGAEISVISLETLDRLGVASLPSNLKMIDASGDRAALRYAQLRGVNFGEVMVDHFELSAAPLSVVRQHIRDDFGRPIDGILGMDFLRASEGLLDVELQVLYLGNPPLLRQWAEWWSKIKK